MDESTQQKISVNARHDVIEHDTEAAGQQLEPPRRPRLHDIQHPEDEKPDDRADDVDRMKRKRDEHPDHLVDDDRPWIDSTEMMFGFGRAPQANDENQHNRAEFDSGRRLTPDELVDDEADGGAKGPRRHRRVANMRARRDENAETTQEHALGRGQTDRTRTTRVPA